MCLGLFHGALTSRTATSTFTQLQSSEECLVVEVLLCVHRNRRLIRDEGAQDGHLDFYTAPELCLVVKCCFTSTETVGLLGTEAQDGHLDFHTAPEF